MKLHVKAVLIAALALPAFCQETLPTPPDPPSPPDSAKIAEQVAKAMAMADKFHIDSDFANLDLNIDVQGLVDLANQVDIAFLQQPAGPPQPPQPPQATQTAPQAGPRPKVMLIQGRGDGAYESGNRALDQHKYDEAVRDFDFAIAAKSPRSDGALYWKAYALNREGKREEALAALAQLRRDYASSAWLHDAQALEAEVKQNAGQPVSPNQETNDDLKLMAINTLMNADAERAIPLVEGILKANAAPNVKDRALFVLAQNKSPRAQQALTDYAKGAGNPDLQLRAIQYVGMSGTKDAQQQLAAIYSASSDARVKTEVLQSLMAARANDALMNIAKTEKDPTLRNTAIREVASSKSTPVETLVELYGASDASAKREIVAVLHSRHEAKTLVDLARKETDPAMKKTIVEHLSSMTDNKDVMDYMTELLK